MGSEPSSKIARLVDHFMAEASQAADNDDWAEADGWVGKWVIVGAGGELVKVFEVKAGTLTPTKPRQEYTAVVTMSEDTFLDLVEAALQGQGEEVFARKYAKRAIEYQGERWIVDSERFRKVLRRLGGVKLGRLP